MPSSKNTVLVDEDGEEVLKLFKNSYLTYKVTFENPISWIVAYCYGLASTDFKIFT
jgi:UDP-glucose 6-dehydrogenase